ncbi:unnamed protein product [Gadus morhua 'NCC']
MVSRHLVAACKFLSNYEIRQRSHGQKRRGLDYGNWTVGCGQNTNNGVGRATGHAPFARKPCDWAVRWVGGAVSRVPFKELEKRVGSRPQPPHISVTTEQQNVQHL